MKPTPSPRPLSLQLALVGLLAASCAPEPPSPPLPTRAATLNTTEAELDDAIALHLISRAEQLLRATDPNERFDTLVGRAPIDAARDSDNLGALFQLGDEAFEAERDRLGGVGRGEPPGPGLPAALRRIQTGELGGLDSSSCRACHFVGGPDGAGAITQVALLRGDGQHLSSATVRDSPHLMGLGYLSLIAREIEADLDRLRRNALRDAVELNQPVTTQLNSKGIDFGPLTALPDGTLDASALTSVSPDLQIRPFGHKGRHADLAALADEALQLHHGLQSASRVATYAGRDDAARWLGDGPPTDPDGDGVVREATQAQAVLLGAYMAMLPVPEIRPPTDPEMALAWSHGFRLMEQVGCTTCHRAELRFTDYAVTIAATDATDLAITIDLGAHGQEPVPRRTDFGADDEGIIPRGVPIFPFTDLRRHDLGPELADPTPEDLPDDADTIPGSVWLTRPLWGLADTAPYLHDGRAPTVADAIEAHGGEAADARQTWRDLSDSDRAALHLFLMSLTRAPTLLVE